jgi:hypothetical protein
MCQFNKTLKRLGWFLDGNQMGQELGLGNFMPKGHVGGM